MRNSKHSSLLMMAAASMISAGFSPGLTGILPPHRSGHRPTPPKRDTELQREIAAHNEAVEKRKAEKKARKATKEPHSGQKD